MAISAYDFELTAQGDHVSLRGVTPEDVLEALRLLESVRDLQASGTAQKSRDLVKLLMTTTEVSSVPAASLRQAGQVAARRDALLATPTHSYETLATARGTNKPASVRTSVARQRERFQVFGVTFDGRTLLPAFQFTDHGQPRPELQPLIQELTLAGVTEWALWTWLTTPSSYLSGGVPEQLAGKDPQRVAVAAKRFAARA